MTTPLQAQSNARNAGHSTGPQSAEGKACVARNAVRYGYCAADIVMPGEDRSAFDALLAEQRDTWSPSNPEQGRCVDELAAALWRRDRLRRTEGELWADRCGATSDTPRGLGEAFAADCESKGRSLDKLRRWWTANQRLIDKLQSRIGLLKHFEGRLYDKFGADVDPAAATVATDMRNAAERDTRHQFRHAMSAPLPNGQPLPVPVRSNEIRESAEQTQLTLSESDQLVAAGTAAVQRELSPLAASLQQARTRKERRALERAARREEKRRARG
ncbi:MAG TPA: hypothetical protein VF678_03535 [bacterium]